MLIPCVKSVTIRCFLVFMDRWLIFIVINICISNQLNVIKNIVIMLQKPTIWQVISKALS